MSRSLEEVLERTLTGAAQAAPQPDPDLLETVHTRQRSIRSARITMAATVGAVAIALAAGVGIVTIPDRHPVDVANDRPTPTPTASFPEYGSLRDLRPADQLWPNAVRRLPGLLPGGERYTLDAIVDGGYVVHTNQKVLLWAPSNGTVRQLGRLVQPSGRSRYAIARVDVGNGHVAWSTAYMGVTSLLEPVGSEVWTAPFARGDQRRILEASKKIDVEELAVVGDDVVIDHGGLSRIPVAGGARVLVPDSVDLNLAENRPWAIGVAAPDRDVSVLNLATNEGRTMPGFNGIAGYEYCSPEFCIATDTTSYSVGRAGNGTKTQRVSFATWCSFTSNPAVAKCISPITGVDITYLVWNIHTGQIARVPAPSVGEEKSWAPRFPNWIDADGDLVLLDPSAIS